MIPQNAIDLAKLFEGLFLKAYLCPAGFWTIGWGHLCRKDHPPITREEAERYLAEDLLDAYMGTIRVCPVLLTVHESWLGAIVDFVFNLGIGRLKSSTLKRRINDQDWDGVVTELNKWVYGGGIKLKGLVIRRKAEGIYFTRKLS